METTRPKPRFNVERIVEDMTLREWNSAHLARAAGVSAMTITRFLRGEGQTAKTAGRIARALGHDVERYFSHVVAPDQREGLPPDVPFDRRTAQTERRGGFRRRKNREKGPDRRKATRDHDRRAGKESA